MFLLSSIELVTVILSSIILLFIIFMIIVITWILRYIDDSSENKRYIYSILNKQAKPNSIVFLGDSLTDFYRIDEFYKKKYIYNRGIAGNTTDDILNRLDDNVINITPRKIFLQIGTNDLGNKKSCDYVINNITKIITILKNELPDADINVISLYPVNAKAMITSKISVGRRKNKDIDFINQKLVDLSGKLGYTYIDVNSSLKDGNGVLRKEYTVEGLHISLHGYIKITEILTPYVF